MQAVRQTIPSYASIVKKDVSVIIKPKNINQSHSKTRSIVRQNVNPVDNDIKLSQVKNVKNGGLAISCDGPDDASKLKELVSQSLSEEYEVKEVRKQSPRVRIVGMSENIACDRMVAMLKSQNHFQKITANMLPLSTLKKTVGPFKATIIFRVMHVNSQSIMNKIDQIEVILDTYRPDIFCVSESWCNEHSINTTNISNYQIANYFIRRNHQHGGVTIYTKQDLVHSRISYVDNLSEEFVLEMCAIQLNSNEKSLCVLAIYRSPSADVEVLIERLSLTLTYCIKKFHQVVVCGDFNINFVKPSEDRNLLSDLIESFNLKIVNLEPTRVFKNINVYVTKIKIDYFLSNVNNIHSENVLNLHLGDHLGLMLDFDFDTCIDESTTRKITFRNTNTEN
nr:unnamed protein product [Callosobruchus analis]